jgi:hypothetical protein
MKRRHARRIQARWIRAYRKAQESGAVGQGVPIAARRTWRCDTCSWLRRRRCKHLPPPRHLVVRAFLALDPARRAEWLGWTGHLGDGHEAPTTDLVAQGLWLADIVPASRFGTRPLPPAGQ